jgi:hypothetical protein
LLELALRRPDRPRSAGHGADQSGASGWEAKRAVSRLSRLAERKCGANYTDW